MLGWAPTSGQLREYCLIDHVTDWPLWLTTLTRPGHVLSAMSGHSANVTTTVTAMTRFIGGCAMAFAFISLTPTVFSLTLKLITTVFWICPHSCGYYRRNHGIPIVVVVCHPLQPKSAYWHSKHRKSLSYTLIIWHHLLYIYFWLQTV